MYFKASKDNDHCTIEVNDVGEIISVSMMKTSTHSCILKSFTCYEFESSAKDAINLILHWDKQCFIEMRKMFNPKWRKIAEDLRIKEMKSWEF